MKLNKKRKSMKKMIFVPMFICSMIPTQALSMQDLAINCGLVLAEFINLITTSEGEAAPFSHDTLSEVIAGEEIYGNFFFSKLVLNTLAQIRTDLSLEVVRCCLDKLPDTDTCIVSTSEDPLANTSLPELTGLEYVCYSDCKFPGDLFEFELE